MIVLAEPHTRLHSGAPWWLIRDGLGEWEGTLRTHCDVVIVGAGITGALVADALTAAGLDVVVLDRRLQATGSTAVCTALLQYELDTELTQLITQAGEAAAVQASRPKRSARFKPSWRDCRTHAALHRARHCISHRGDPLETSRETEWDDDRTGAWQGG